MRNRRQAQSRNRRKERRSIIILLVLLIAAGVITAGAFIGWKFFILEKVDIVGNEIYTDEQIERWVLSEDYSWNTLYLVFRNRFRKQEEIPFVDSMEIRLVSPVEVEITVKEKGMLGYAYIPTQGQNAYFDQEGFVVEISDEEIYGVTKIAGLEIENVGLYEKLGIADEDVLTTMLSLARLLEKYDLSPEIIYFTDPDIFLSYGEIQVNLGSDAQLDEKILRLKEILPELEGQSGTLHMENWDETNADIYFKPGEFIEIPVDRQVVSGLNFKVSGVESVSEEEGGSEADAESQEPAYEEPVYYYEEPAYEEPVYYDEYGEYY